MPREAPRFLSRPDGRRLAWTELGAPRGRPVLVLHGSPGCRFARFDDEKRLVDADIRLISYDRPGYADSDPLPGRRIADAVGDIEAVLDAAQVPQAALLGTSGGGPHALAAAVLIPGRVRVAHCHGGCAPRAGFDGDWFAGMDRQNVRRLQTTALPREQAHAALKADLDHAVAAARVDPMTIHANMELPEADRQVMRVTGPAYAANLLEALRPGYWGFVDDFAAHMRDWGFDPRTAKAPVVIEYGAHDVNVPAAHGRWLAARIPGAAAIVNASAGHRSMPEQAFQRLLRLASMA